MTDLSKYLMIRLNAIHNATVASVRSELPSEIPNEVYEEAAQDDARRFEILDGDFPYPHLDPPELNDLGGKDTLESF